MTFLLGACTTHRFSEDKNSLFAKEEVQKLSGWHSELLMLFFYNGVGQGRRRKGRGICAAVEFPLFSKSATLFAARLTKVVEGEGKGRQSNQSLMELVQ